MATEIQSLGRWQIYTYADKLSYVPKSGEPVYFNSVVTGQLSPVAIIGDGISQVDELPFIDKLELSITNNLDIQALRISGNRIKIYNSNASVTVEIEIGVTASSKTFYLLAGKSVDLFFNGSDWMHESENIITMTDANLILGDASGPTRVIMPSSGITANRTVTLPTLADNQKNIIRFENQNTSYLLFIDGEGAETIESLATINLSNEYSVLEGNSSEWKRIDYSPIRPTVWGVDKRATTVNGGAAGASSWTIRQITDLLKKTINTVSLTSNRILLPPGQYRVTAKIAFYGTAQTKCRVFNNDDGVPLSYSLSSNLSTDNLVSIDSYFTLDYAVSKNIEIDYYGSNVVAVNGLGVATSDGADEYYLSVIFEKII